MDYNIPKMEGYKIHPFNILQTRKGIVTTERHNKDSRQPTAWGSIFCLLHLFTSPEGSTSKESPPEPSGNQKMPISIQILPPQARYTNSRQNVSK